MPAPGEVGAPLIAAAVIGALSPVAALSTIMLLSSQPIVLLCVGLRKLIGDQHPLQSPETPHWMQRLERVRPGAALVIGMILIAVSPADLVAYFSAHQRAVAGGSAGLFGVLLPAQGAIVLD